jgi:UDP-N-acetylmuramyl pentapeptide phosphotransferase/UDP-N-acetylglucosamine-1-phosphate transferase
MPVSVVLNADGGHARARSASVGMIGALTVVIQTEVLLLIIGGIFVIEALSVAIQVFSSSRPSAAASS